VLIEENSMMLQRHFSRRSLQPLLRKPMERQSHA